MDEQTFLETIVQLYNAAIVPANEVAPIRVDDIAAVVLETHSFLRESAIHAAYLPRGFADQLRSGDLGAKTAYSDIASKIDVAPGGQQKDSVFPLSMFMEPNMYDAVVGTASDIGFVQLKDGKVAVEFLGDVTGLTYSGNAGHLWQYKAANPMHTF